MERPRTFFKSLWARLATGFVAIIIISGVLQFLAVARTWQALTDEVNQGAYWNVAAELAARIQRELPPSASARDLRERLSSYSMILPGAELYFIDSEGKILESMTQGFELRRKHVSMEPLRRALAPVSPDLPLYADKPTSHEDDAIFSIAPLYALGTAGYLFVIPTGHTYRVLIETAGQFYLVNNALLGILIVLLATMLTGLLLFRYLSKHFRELTSVVREYESGKFDRRVPVQSNDEVAELGRAVNQMADRIVASTEELKHTDSVRRHLVATISHDLRGPLTSMKGFLHLLREQGGRLSAQESREYWQAVQDSIGLQSRLVEDLFELSTLEAREKKPVLEAFSIEELAEAVLGSLEREAKTKSLDLSLECRHTQEYVSADMKMISRMLNNLLANSIRFTPEGGAVRLVIEDQHNRVAIVVQDSGIGIPQAELSLLFDPFYRGSTALDAQIDGTGLGLAIVKRIAELHGTDITVESRVGEGTTFRFSLAADRS